MCDSLCKMGWPYLSSECLRPCRVDLDVCVPDANGEPFHVHIGEHPVKEHQGRALGVAPSTYRTVEIDIVARAGFAGSDVRAVAVGIADAQRVVDLAPGLHAFVVIGPAVTWRLTPLGSTGRPIGDVEVIEAQ